MDIKSTLNNIYNMNELMPTNPKIVFGLNLKRIRQSKGLSQEELAAIAGLDRTYISGCERGKRNISLENIWRISEALEISPAVFFDVTHPKSSV